jgi:hypothetical protein
MSYCTRRVSTADSACFFSLPQRAIDVAIHRRCRACASGRFECARGEKIGLRPCKLLGYTNARAVEIDAACVCINAPDVYRNPVVVEMDGSGVYIDRARFTADGVGFSARDGERD